MTLRWLQQVFDMTSSVSNMIGLAITVLFLTHLVACLWFLQAKQSDFEDNSWVMQEGMYAETVIFQYTMAVHWAL